MGSFFVFSITSPLERGDEPFVLRDAQERKVSQTVCVPPHAWAGDS